MVDPPSSVPHPGETPARDFARDYQLGRLPAMRELERDVLGCDYGGTSWTTRAEAERLCALLGLRPGMRLLDLGAGSGWPALYLAGNTGCEVVLSDLPLVGLQIAAERAGADGLHERCAAVTADGAALPFREGSFDALSHSDVLCCMPGKLGMLQECRRVARPRARMVFSVIALATSLSASERRIAADAGPPYVDVDRDYALLLRELGWRVLQRMDVTAEYVRCVRALVDGMKARAGALTEVLGAKDVAERVRRRQAAVAAIDRGFLKREIFVTRKNG